MRQSRFAQHGLNLFKSRLSRFPELGSGQRVKKAAAQVQRDCFRPGEVDRGLGASFDQPPVFAAEIGNSFGQREPGAAERVQIAEDGAGVDLEFLAQLLHGLALAAVHQCDQDPPLALHGC